MKSTSINYKINDKLDIESVESNQKPIKLEKKEKDKLKYEILAKNSALINNLKVYDEK